MYREVDSTLDWGIGESYRMIDYLNDLENDVPNDPDEAEDYLLTLQRNGFLQSHHVTYLYEKCVDPQ